ncbi:nephrin-like isoform X3 [Apostichopus japonicus]
MTGNRRSAGNLQITTVELGDDATYECMVIASAGHPPLTSLPAFLTVQVAPTAPVIDGYEDGALITVQPPEAVSLICRSTNGKPAASISWLKEGQPFLYSTPSVITETSPHSSGKLENAVSTLELLPEKEDNGIVFTCKMEHPALAEPLTVSVTLNVLFAPSPPLINGYTDSTIVKTNDELTLDCSSRGGNPLAEVYWYKNGERMDYSYTTDGVTARNVLPLTVGYGDNNAIFRCEATSVVLDEPMTAQVILTVLFAPAFVNITGYENMVHNGESLTLTCISGNSNPAASIIWLTGGRQVQTHQDVVTEAQNGGFITTQKLNITMAAAVDKVDYMCQATNQDLFETVHKVVTVSVMYPPDTPIITGYNEGAEVKARSLLRLQCYANGGNPLATLQWYKNGQPLESVKGTSTTVASAELTIILEKTDNGALYQCNATNTATPQPLQANKTLNVLFPPDTVRVIATPAVAAEGDRVNISCVTASSNPASAITWWRDGVPFGENLSAPEVKNGDNGGHITSSNVIVESLTWQNNGGVYLCRAMNDLLEESVNDGLTLDVQYKPRITTPEGISITTREVQGIIKLNCSANGNPSELTHTWKKDDVDVDVGEDTKYTLTSEGSLHIQAPTRNEAGPYSCVVSNSVGESSITTTLNVEYAATITTGNSITITLNTDQDLVCTADANPRPDGFVTWTREGFDISMHTALFRDGNGVLQIQNVSKSDAGMYTCHADNGIEPAAKTDINVIIQYKPEIDYSVPNKIAKMRGQTALLFCNVEGAPVVRFRWLKGGTEVNLTSHHYTLDNRQHVRYTNHYESRLIISHIQVFHYGAYICEAYNALGKSTFQINVERTSSPESPTDVKILVITHRSVSLNWTAGFNGGLPQTFQVRFNTLDAKQYQYIDVDPPNSTYFVVEHLNPETKYEFTVRGRNALGDGPYYLGVVLGKTKAKPIVPTFRPQILMVGNLPLYAVLLLAFVIILSCMFLNFILCCYLVKKRFSRKSGEIDDKKKAEIELTKPESETGRSSPVATESTGSRSRHGSDEYSYDDRHHEYQDYRSYDAHQDDGFYDDDMRPIADLDNRETLPSYYNSGYPRKPSYQPSWDSYYRPGPDSYVSDSQASEELEEMDYAGTLRRKQREDPFAHSAGTPSPVPSDHGNFIPLKKGGAWTATKPDSQEGFLV